MNSSLVNSLLTGPINSPNGNFYNKVNLEYLALPCQENPNKLNNYEVIFKVFVEDGLIKSARVEVFAEPLFTAACLWCIAAIRGKTLFEAKTRLNMLDISKDFGFIPQYYYTVVFPKILTAASVALDI